VVGREDRPERRGYDIELGFAERQRLCVGLHPLDRNAARFGLRASSLEVLGCDVGRDDLRSGFSRTDRDVTAAGRYIEDTLTGGDPTRRDNDGTDLPHLLARERW
jgi:hypothetical protein